MINFIVLAATIITEKIDNYRYNNSLVKEKIIFITIIINSVEKKYFQEVRHMTSIISLMTSSYDDRLDICEYFFSHFRLL